MEIRRWHCYFLINCALIIPLLNAKSFSINEALAAESKLQRKHSTTPSISTETNNRFSLNKALDTEPIPKSRKFKSDKHYSSPIKFGKFSSLKPKTLSELTSHLKSKRLSGLFRPLYKRKRQSLKREIHKNDKIDEKYFPLFRNLGLLFDNLLNESGESYETSKKKLKQRKNSDEGRGVVCSCAVKSDNEPSESRSHKKTIVSAKTISFPSFTSEKSTSAAPATYTTLGDVGSFRQDKDIPLLLPRDTSSSGGDDNGHGERSRTAFHRSAQRDFARNLRNRKHPARDREYEFSAEYDEEDPYSDTRNDASRDESGRGRNRGNIDYSYERKSTYENTELPKTKKTNRNFRGHVYELSKDNKLKTRRNKTESEEFVPKHIRGIRGPLSENKIGDIAESIQSEEDNEEGFFSVPFNNTSDKRFAVGSGTPTGENQEVRPRDETVISINDLSNVNLALQRKPGIDVPSVSIIDGYSVARDKNGQNKLTEKTIRIHV